jgi:amino acid adenylation domain-containing protein
MTVIEVLAAAKKAGVNFYLDQGKLAFKAPKGAFTNELKQQVVLVKNELVTLLQESHERIERPIAQGQSSGPLSRQQRSQFAIYSRSPNATSYHIALPVQISHKVTDSELNQCLEQIFLRHIAFQTRFRMDAQGVVQFLDTTNQWPIKRSENVLNFDSWAKECFEQPFVLLNDFAYRVHISKDENNNHIILLVIHHIIFDGWSVGLLLKTFEDSLLKKHVNSEDAFNYLDYSYWQYTEQGQNSLRKGLAFWQQHLDNAPQQHNLPLLPAPILGSGFRFNKTISLALSQQLNVFAKQHQVTPFVVLHTLYALVLGHYSSSNDFIIGVPVANRPLAELEGLIGNFVNTIPTRVQWRNEISFTELLAIRKQRYQLELTNQSVPFEDLVKEVIGNESLNHHPLFQVMFSFQNEQPVEYSLTDLIQTVPFSLALDSTKFDLHLDVGKGEDGYIFSWQFNTGNFAESLIASIWQTFYQGLQAILTNADQPIANLITLSKEHSKQLEDWNATAKLFPSGTMVEQFTHHQTMANGIALSDGNTQLTYKEFNTLTCQWGHLLQQRGVIPNSLVALYLPRSIDMVLALHGVWQAGGAYLPLDIAHPQKRIADILANANPICVITTKALATDLPADINKVILDDDDVIAEHLAASNTSPKVERQSDDTAYVIYTSGSTGMPKGVMVSHAALVNRIDWMQTQYPLNHEDVVIQKTPYTFDVSVWELVWPFYSGARLSVAKAEGHKDPEYLSDFIVAEGVSVMHFVPSMLTAMLAHGELNRASRLRYVFASGEALLSSTVSAFYRSGSTASLHNLYGPTEAAIDVSYWDCSAQDNEQVPIGKPIQNISLHVLDSTLRHLPLGAIGELYIGGVGLAKGYLNQESLTAERFIISPLTDERLYKTGDLAYWQADGQLIYVGRSDFQVKLRGLRIELGEIEVKLLSVAGIREAAVVIQAEQLVAYYTGDALDVSVIEQVLHEQLPKYMIPKYYVLLAVMPLSANGKLARNALPAVVMGVSTTDYAAPEGELEVLVSLAWQQVLGLEKISRFDNFFSLGGDSISVLQVVSYLKQHGLVIGLEKAYEHLVLKDLAAAVLSNQEVKLLPHSEGVQQLSPLAMWYRWHAQDSFHHFHQSAVVQIDSSIPKEKIVQAVTVLVERHDALRLCLHVENHLALYRPFDDSLLDSTFQYIESEQQSIDSWKSYIVQVGKEAKATWNLFEQHACKIFVFKNNTLGKQCMVCIIHHIAVDTVSWNILLQDLQSLLAGKVISGRQSSYQQWFSEKHYQQITHLFNSPQKAKIAHLPWSEKQRVVGEVEATKIAIWQASLLNSHLSIHHVLMISVMLAYQDQTGIKSVTLDNEIHGRLNTNSQIDSASIVGWLTDIEIVEISDIGSDFNQRVFQVIYRLFQSEKFNSHYWLKQSEDALTKKRDIQFNYLGQESNELVNGDITLWGVDSGADIGEHFPFLYQCIVTSKLKKGDLLFAVDYNPLLLTEHAMHRLMEQIFEYAADIVNLLMGQPEHIDVLIAQAKSQLPEYLNVEHKREHLYVPTTLMQQAMYIDCEASPQVDKYVTQTLLTFAGQLDVHRLQLAWHCVIEKYSILQASFLLTDMGGLFQQINPNHRLNIIDSRATDGSANYFKKQDKARGFDLQHDLLIRLRLIKNERQQEQLIITHHHILMDGWSFGIVLNDVMQAYKTNVFSYPVQNNFAYFEWLSKYDKPSAEVYWHAQLAVLENATLLQKNSNLTALIVEKTQFTLGETKEITAFCQLKGFSVNQFLQAVWGYLLSKLTHQNTVSFGQIVNGRHPDLVGCQSMVGLFINTIPKVAQVDPSDETAHYISTLQDPAQLSAEFLPLSVIQKLAPHIDGILFDSLFVFENYPVQLEKEEDQSSDIQLLNILGEESTGFPVTLVVSPGEQLQVKLQVKGQLNLSAQSLLASFHHIACQFANCILLTDVSLTPTSHTQQLEDWNATAKPFPSGTMVEQLTHHHSLADGIALSDGNKQITYKEFNVLTCQWGHLLQQRGVVPNSLVALYLPRSIEMVLVLHGVWQAGGAYLPLDIAHPQQRTADILANANPICVITTAELAVDLPVDINKVILDDEDVIAEHFAASSTSPKVERQGGDTAYVIYTSGSTGMPKGVMVSHEALVNRIDWMQTQYPLNHEDVVIQKTPYTFDVSVWELVWPFYSGARLSVVKAEGHKDPEYLSDFIVAEGVSVMHFVPSMLTAMLEHGELSRASRLRYVFSSGEALLSSTVSAFYRSGSPASLHNLYGPTEAAIDVSYWDCSAQDNEQVPIGKPIQNISLHVLDSQLRHLPLGAIGELYIGGVGLAKGYLNQESLTAERFIVSPLTDERLYKTGDLAYWRADGQLMYVGRSDFQVKLRGLRIELGEIEATLLSVAGIWEAAVVVQAEQLVAYYTGEALDVSVIELMLHEQLPKYMVPSHYVLLDVMPLSANGKLARNALPAVTMGVSTNNYAAPEGELEVLVSLAWQQVLGIDKVSRFDNFFSLGGDSLLVLKLLANLKRATKINIPLSVLLEHGVLAKQALEIQNKHRDEEQPLEQVPELQLVPLTQAQQRMWLLQELEPNSSQFHMARVLKLTGNVDKIRIAEALKQVQFHHGALRTKLVSHQQQVWQQQGAVNLELIDVIKFASGVAENDGIKQLIDTPFDLMMEYPIRVFIISAAENESILVFVAHHMFCDGLSMEIIANSFEQYYANIDDKPNHSVGPHYIDYANYLNQHTQRNSIHEEWWQQYLAGSPECHELVLKGQRTAQLSVAGESVSHIIEGEQLSLLRQMAKDLGISIFHLFHGLTSILVSQYSGQTDVVIGSPMANRHHSQTQDIVGLFLDTFVIRHQNDDTCSVAQWLQRTAENCLSAMKHGELGFEKVVELINPSRGHHSPIFQIFINHIRTSAIQQQASSSDFTISEISLAQDTAKYELSLYCLEQEEQLELLINYRSALFSHSTISQYMRSLCLLLDSVVDYQHQPLVNLPLCTAQDLSISEGATHALAYNNICDWFFKCANEHGQGLAITCDDKTLTYTQLENRIMVLASCIKRYSPEIKRVMIFSERNIDFVPLILACWHLGIVVIPVDSQTPEHRAQHIYQDCQADLVLVQDANKVFASSNQVTISQLLLLESQDEQKHIPANRQNNNVAYIIYTSGSTGKPKGVCGTHIGLVNRIQWMKKSYPYTSNTAVQITQTGFIRHLWETFLPLLSGKHITIMESNYYQDPAKFFSSLRDIGCDRIVTTPTVLQSFCQYAKETGDTLDIGFWFVSGEPFSPSIASEALEQFGKTQFVNLYGSTEVTSDITSYTIKKTDENSTVSLGSAIDNTSVIVVNSLNQPLPKMAKGQIAVSGSSLAQGYWQMSAENSAFSTLFGCETRIYLTGDFGYIDVNNELKLIGRKDEQVNLGGYRCELNEIRHAMMQLDQVDDVCIQIKQENEPYIAAYVASPLLAKFKGKKLADYLHHAKRELNEWLPYYMLPKSIQIVPSFPLTANGKLDKEKLYSFNVEYAEELKAETATELLLLELIGNLLNISNVNISKNFFELGGTSIKASQLRNQLSERLQISFPLKTLFSAPTIGSLAIELDNIGKEQALLSHITATELDTEGEEFII